jgi:hypothetical protein
MKAQPAILWLAKPAPTSHKSPILRDVGESGVCLSDMDRTGTVHAFEVAARENHPTSMPAEAET